MKSIIIALLMLLPMVGAGQVGKPWIGSIPIGVDTLGSWGAGPRAVYGDLGGIVFRFKGELWYSREGKGRQVEMYGVKVSQDVADAYWASLQTEPDTLWWLAMEGRVVDAKTVDRIMEHCIGYVVTDSNYRGYGVGRTMHYIVEREASANDFARWMLRRKKPEGK